MNLPICQPCFNISFFPLKLTKTQWGWEDYQKHCILIWTRFRLRIEIVIPAPIQHGITMLHSVVIWEVNRLGTIVVDVSHFSKFCIAPLYTPVLFCFWYTSNKMLGKKASELVWKSAVKLKWRWRFRLGSQGCGVEQQALYDTAWKR